MAFRTSWKGYLKLSLVSVPVKSYSAVSPDEGEIHFHQLHSKCHSRIKYVKTCPVHGPVPSSEIVKGYEYAKGEYVEVEEAELDALRSDEEKAVNVEAIVSRGAIDSLYLTERSSYLVPDGRVGEKPYAVIEQCLDEEDAIAVGRLVINGKDQVVMIRPLEGLLVMTILSSAVQVKPPKAFAPERPKVNVTAAEVKLTKSLFEAFHQEEIDLSQYTDHYSDRLAELINAKVTGKEVVMPAPSEEPDVINLMDALKKSLAQTKSTPAKAHPSRKVKSSSTSSKAAAGKAPAKRKSKTA